MNCTTHRPVNRPIAFLAISIVFNFATATHAAEVKETYDDGKPKLVYHTDAAHRKTGAYEEFYPGGKLHIRGQYTIGKKSGQWTVYGENGKLVEMENFRADLLEGPYSWNFPSGKPGMRATYHLGQLYGPISVTDEKGSISRRVNYPRSIDAVRKAFLSLFYSEKPAVKFTTEPVTAPPYKAGVLSPQTLEAAVKVTKLYRYLSGVPYEDLKADATLCDKSAHGAVVLTKIGSLTHTPSQPSDMDAAFFKIAYTGCSEDNLYQGNGNPVDAVRGFMDDSDASNVEKIGHRQWVLCPGLQNVGFGSAGAFVSMHVFDGTRSVKLDYNYIAFPGEGFYPIRLIGPQFAWSLHINKSKAKIGSKDSIKVSISKLDEHYQPTGDPIPTKVVSTPAPMSPSFGWETIVFKPEFETLEPGRYWVEVVGVMSPTGAAAPFGYIVELVDIQFPEKAAAN
ncbi:MAG TPA: hypothetical protein VFC46_13185 [Humisphaera sp.]|nr:hypothetical protein [Humisphaera sp.]